VGAPSSSVDQGDSVRFPVYADVERMEREAFASLDFRNPRIDKAAVEEAVTECLALCGAPERRFRWFADVRLSRKHVFPYEVLRAYWPLGAADAVPLLDAAWRAGTSGFGWFRSPWSSSLHSAHFHYFDQMLNFGRIGRHRLPELLVRRSHMDTAAYQAACAAVAAPMLKAFVAGLFYLEIGRREVVCVPRPSLRIVGGRLHCEDGPALAWPTGECRYFWNGVHVPDYVIERPHQITPLLIRLEENSERRRCMIERFGIERFLREVDAKLVGEDHSGRLWRADFDTREIYAVLEVENGTLEPDGTRRRYFLRVPSAMQSAREAAAWTYGLSPGQYDVAVRT
jgi:hypothetical protein